MVVIKSSLILLSLFFGHHVSCTPLANSPEALEARGLSTCQVVSDIVKILHNPALAASATKFCSSFISIPLQTATKTATTTTTPPPVTATATITAAAFITVTTTLGLPLTTNVNPPPGVTITVEKRTNPTLPPYLSVFASSKVSAACSCLSIKPATTTVPATNTVTAPASVRPPIPSQKPKCKKATTESYF
ncbi:MAG: hypothetical protein L6R37_007297 [Teloschistes peruensis]|nr:MAG: hypothetical protein L6R37_007297 [Teloschistes peruensis]